MDEIHNIDSRAETSNQAIITSELLKSCNGDLLADLVRRYGADGWEKVYDMAVCLHLTL